jgi:hypothetical protein
MLEQTEKLMVVANLELILKILANLSISLFSFYLQRKTNLNAGVERLNRSCQEEYFLRSFHKLPDNFNDLRSFVKQKQFH